HTSSIILHQSYFTHDSRKKNCLEKIEPHSPWRDLLPIHSCVIYLFLKVYIVISRCRKTKGKKSPGLPLPEIIYEV
ncbi:MAG: hypothetical protein RBR05_07015, partial [Candidatus Methanomethylophilaceae archaeon]|nr:hypothetical protein [Candidatus Methanomethylophilaceae archaeon]